MSTKGTKSSKSSILKIGPNLTIDCTSEIQSKFNKAIEQKKAVKINSELIESIDLSGIQLLLLMKRTSQSENSVEFNLSFSDSTKDLLSKCGFSDYLLA